MSKFVVMTTQRHDRTSAPTPPVQASRSLVLRSLQDPGSIARLDAFESADAAHAIGGEVYEVLLRVTGAWIQSPGYAVHAVWEIQDTAHAEAFVESRRQLFALRQQVLPTFAEDWLLKHSSQAGRYMVIGFYGDEEGATRLCREHPEIRKFAAAHPASDYSAVDRSGLLCWRVDSPAPLRTR
jgi:hypothetical protein